MLPMVPGQIATVLVAFAVTPSSPRASRVGYEISVPPPATELIAPAAKADPNAAAAVKALKVDTKYQLTRPHSAPQIRRTPS
jgi:hypothetical protein